MVFQVDETGVTDVVAAILELRPFPKKILLEGELGSGKTTLVKALVKALGSDDTVNSPTFGILNEYYLPDGGSIYHSDWYRIKDISELYDAGMEEYIDSENLMIIEWPNVGLPLLEGEPFLHISITHENGSRTYKITGK